MVLHKKRAAEHQNDLVTDDVRSEQRHVRLPVAPERPGDPGDPSHFDHRRGGGCDAHLSVKVLSWVTVVRREAAWRHSALTRA